MLASLFATPAFADCWLSGDGTYLSTGTGVWAYAEQYPSSPGGCNNAGGVNCVDDGMGGSYIDNYSYSYGSCYEACTFTYSNWASSTVSSGGGGTTYNTSNGCSGDAWSCSSGSISGASNYTGYSDQSSCIAQLACALPWGGSLDHGTTYGGPLYDNGAPTDACSNHTASLSCLSTVLSAQNTSNWQSVSPASLTPSCIEPAACGATPHGSTFNGYAYASVDGMSCGAPVDFTCTNGTFYYMGNSYTPSASCSARCYNPFTAQYDNAGSTLDVTSINGATTATNGCSAAATTLTCTEGTYSNGTNNLTTHPYSTGSCTQTCTNPTGGPDLGVTSTVSTTTSPAPSGTTCSWNNRTCQADGTLSNPEYGDYGSCADGCSATSIDSVTETRYSGEPTPFNAYYPGSCSTNSGGTCSNGAGAPATGTYYSSQYACELASTCAIPAGLGGGTMPVGGSTITGYKPSPADQTCAQRAVTVSCPSAGAPTGLDINNAPYDVNSLVPFGSCTEPASCGATPHGSTFNGYAYASVDGMSCGAPVDFTCTNGTFWYMGNSYTPSASCSARCYNPFTAQYDNASTTLDASTVSGANTSVGGCAAATTTLTCTEGTYSNGGSNFTTHPYLASTCIQMCANPTGGMDINSGGTISTFVESLPSGTACSGGTRTCQSTGEVDNAQFGNQASCTNGCTIGGQAFTGVDNISVYLSPNCETLVSGYTCSTLPGEYYTSAEACWLAHPPANCTVPNSGGQTISHNDYVILYSNTKPPAGVECPVTDYNSGTITANNRSSTYAYPGDNTNNIANLPGEVWQAKYSGIDVFDPFFVTRARCKNGTLYNAGFNEGAPLNSSGGYSGYVQPGGTAQVPNGFPTCTQTCTDPTNFMLTLNVGQGVDGYDPNPSDCTSSYRECQPNGTVNGNAAFSSATCVPYAGCDATYADIGAVHKSHNEGFTWFETSNCDSQQSSTCVMTTGAPSASPIFSTAQNCKDAVACYPSIGRIEYMGSMSAYNINAPDACTSITVSCNAPGSPTASDGSGQGDWSTVACTPKCYNQLTSTYSYDSVNVTDIMGDTTTVNGCLNSASTLNCNSGNYSDYMGRGFAQLPYSADSCTQKCANPQGANLSPTNTIFAFAESAPVGAACSGGTRTCQSDGTLDNPQFGDQPSCASGCTYNYIDGATSSVSSGNGGGVWGTYNSCAGDGWTCTDGGISGNISSGGGYSTPELCAAQLSCALPALVGGTLPNGGTYSGTPVYDASNPDEACSSHLVTFTCSGTTLGATANGQSVSEGQMTTSCTEPAACGGTPSGSTFSGYPNAEADGSCGAPVDFTCTNGTFWYMGSPYAPGSVSGSCTGRCYNPFTASYTTNPVDVTNVNGNTTTPNGCSNVTLNCSDGTYSNGGDNLTTHPYAGGSCTQMCANPTGGPDLSVTSTVSTTTNPAPSGTTCSWNSRTCQADGTVSNPEYGDYGSCADGCSATSTDSVAETRYSGEITPFDAYLPGSCSSNSGGTCSNGAGAPTGTFYSTQLACENATTCTIPAGLGGGLMLVGAPTITGYKPSPAEQTCAERAVTVSCPSAGAPTGLDINNAPYDVNSLVPFGSCTEPASCGATPHGSTFNGYAYASVDGMSCGAPVDFTCTNGTFWYMGNSYTPSASCSARCYNPFTAQYDNASTTLDVTSISGTTTSVGGCAAATTTLTCTEGTYSNGGSNFTTHPYQTAACTQMCANPTGGPDLSVTGTVSTVTNPTPSSTTCGWNSRTCQADGTVSNPEYGDYGTCAAGCSATSTDSVTETRYSGEITPFNAYYPGSCSSNSGGTCSAGTGAPTGTFYSTQLACENATTCTIPAGLGGGTMPVGDSFSATKPSPAEDTCAERAVTVSCSAPGTPSATGGADVNTLITTGACVEPANCTWKGVGLANKAYDTAAVETSPSGTCNWGYQVQCLNGVVSNPSSGVETCTDGCTINFINATASYNYLQGFDVFYAPDCETGIASSCASPGAQGYSTAEACRAANPFVACTVPNSGGQTINHGEYVVLYSALSPNDGGACPVSSSGEIPAANRTGSHGIDGGQWGASYYLGLVGNQSTFYVSRVLCQNGMLRTNYVQENNVVNPDSGAYPGDFGNGNALSITSSYPTCTTHCVNPVTGGQMNVNDTVGAFPDSAPSGTICSGGTRTCQASGEVDHAEYGTQASCADGCSATSTDSVTENRYSGEITPFNAYYPVSCSINSGGTCSNGAGAPTGTFYSTQLACETATTCTIPAGLGGGTMLVGAPTITGYKTSPAEQTCAERAVTVSCNSPGSPSTSDGSDVNSLVTIGSCTEPASCGATPHGSTFNGYPYASVDGMSCGAPVDFTCTNGNFIYMGNTYTPSASCNARCLNPFTTQYDNAGSTLDVTSINGTTTSINGCTAAATTLTCAEGTYSNGTNNLTTHPYLSAACTQMCVNPTGGADLSVTSTVSTVTDPAPSGTTCSWNTRTCQANGEVDHAEYGNYGTCENGCSATSTDSVTENRYSGEPSTFNAYYPGSCSMNSGGSCSNGTGAPTGTFYSTQLACENATSCTFTQKEGGTQTVLDGHSVPYYQDNDCAELSTTCTYPTMSVNNAWATLGACQGGQLQCYVNWYEGGGETVAANTPTTQYLRPDCQASSISCGNGDGNMAGNVTTIYHTAEKCSQDASCTFGAFTLAHGASKHLTKDPNPSGPCEEIDISCTDGMLSNPSGGSSSEYIHESTCTRKTQCTHNAVLYDSGSDVPSVYSSDYPDTACSNYVGTGLCTEGVITLNGGTAYSNCNEPASCSVNGTPYASGDTNVPLYETDLPTGSCTSVFGTCIKGSLSRNGGGSYTETCVAGCSVPVIGSSNVGLTGNGSSTTLYTPGTCGGFSVTCSNGSFGNPDGYADQEVCRQASKCTLPWGADLFVGDNPVTAYDRRYSNDDCSLHTTSFSCVLNSGLQGNQSFTFQQCDPAAACSLPYGGTMPSGQIDPPVYGYNDASPNDGCEAHRVQFTCDNGTLTGDQNYNLSACAPAVGCTIAFGGGYMNSGATIPEAYIQAVVDGSCTAASLTCEDGQLYANGSPVGSNDYTSATCRTANVCTLPYGGTMASGQVDPPVYGYNIDFADDDCSNHRTQFTCNDGTLGGDSVTYHFGACNPAASCTSSDNQTIASGSQTTLYDSASTLEKGQCATTAKLVTCRNGEFKDMSNLTVTGYIECHDGCKLEDLSYPHGTTDVPAYMYSNHHCEQTTPISCSNGDWNNTSYTFKACTQGCELDGVYYDDDTTLTVFNLASETMETACMSQDRHCTGGNFDGSAEFHFLSCANACPLGDTKALSGQTVTAYRYENAPYPGDCGQTKQRQCVNGSFTDENEAGANIYNKAACEEGEMPECD